MIWFVAGNADYSSIVLVTRQVSPAILGFTFVTTLIAALFASVRLFVTARLFGYPISFREAVAALSLGQVAGVLFFQLAGQLIARGAWLAGSQVPIAGTVVVTGYERLSALVASVLIASVGAIYLFGRIQWNAGTSGLEPARLAFGLVAVGAIGGWLAWGDLARSIVKLLTPRIAVQFAINLGLSMLVQVATMAGYVILARMFSPTLDLFSLAAASSLVMLAASVPISFAGWGVREMSAVAALGAIGLAPESALLVAVMIGAMSMAAVGLLALTAISLKRTRLASAATATAHDYSLFLDVAIPLIVASALFFQIYVPVSRGLLNVNLADPFVLLGGGIFVAHAFGAGAPRWRLPSMLLYVAAATLVLTLAYLHGLALFGWTSWAFTNKFLGWFVLLAYGATGALIAWRFENGRDRLIRTLVATAIGVMAVDVIAQILFRSGIAAALSFATTPLSGFSQNRNAFSFLLLLCVVGIITTHWQRRYILIGLMIAGVMLTESRAGFVALAAIMLIAFWLGSIRAAELLRAAVVAALSVVTVLLLPEIILRTDLALHAGIAGLVEAGQGQLAPNYSSLQTASVGSDIEHFSVFYDGWKMFLAHPLFGAGLGAYFEQTRRAGSGIVIHSVALWLAAETGLVGLVIFCAAPVCILVAHWRRAANERSSLLLVLLLVAFSVMSLAHEILYQRGFWLLLGAALVVPATAKITKLQSTAQVTTAGNGDR